MSCQDKPFSQIVVCAKPDFRQPEADHLLHSVREYLKVPVEALSIQKVYTIYKNLNDQQLQAIAFGPLVDPITEEGKVGASQEEGYDWIVEIGYKNGMTDNAGNAAKITIEDFLRLSFSEGEKVRSSVRYLFKGELSASCIQTIAEKMLANPLIEEIYINSSVSSPSRMEDAATTEETNVETIAIDVSDEELVAISKNRQLALSLDEMRAIRSYYIQDAARLQREKYHLPRDPTDVELEALAQTWSEHCKHKIFNAKITYMEEGSAEVIDSLFTTCIRKATEELAAVKPWLVSVFSDNAGIIAFDSDYNIAFKVETHNSPSALDPYGGALTGVLGVNRDIMGVGIGARLVANTDVFCFASPSYDKPLPPRILHPKRIFEGVRKGVEHGGNKSGVPTVNGAIVFDEHYLGKPLVYCGSIGIMPKNIKGAASHKKEIYPGDAIVVAGGRTGRDGIHGATFSSEELHEQSPTSAVQIGDPFTQKKLHDFLLEARDRLLYRTVTDNGAGGFSSSIGELAELSKGCEVYLDNALLKSLSLKPWEILLSESQERMTFAVPQENLKELFSLAAIHEVELCTLGKFTDTGNFHILHNAKTVGLLPLSFLHDGVPQLELEAVWENRSEASVPLPQKEDYTDDLKRILARENVCSKERVIRQYDHEVQGGSAGKPLVGASFDGPADAAIIRPIESLEKMSCEGIVISNGICPKFSAFDTYHMAASAVDEAVRNYIAVGGDPDHIAILDNFCWPDPVYDPDKTVDGKYKLAQLVRANKALYTYAKAFGTPIISGKDSMKNDYKLGGVKISVPPTLLISAIGKIPDVEKAVSMDVKKAGDAVYLIGRTRNEIGGSEYALQNSIFSGIVPKVDALQALKSYQTIYKAICRRLLSACHDCSDGGLAAALAEMAFAGGLGMSIDLSKIPTDESLCTASALFSESNSRLIVTVSPENEDAFSQLFEGIYYAKIGFVRNDALFKIVSSFGSTVVEDDISSFKSAWQAGL